MTEKLSSTEEKLNSMIDKIESMTTVMITLNKSIQNNLDHLKTLYVRFKQNRDSLRHSCFDRNIRHLSAKAKTEEERISFASQYLKTSCEDCQITSYTKCTLKDFQSYFKIIRLLSNKP